MKSNRNAAQTPNDLLAELRTLVADAEAMIAGATEHSTDAFNALRSRFEAIQEGLTDAYTETRKKVVAGAKYTDETIRANPYQSLAIAAGVGLIVGVLAGRNSN
jgi:ElaB/YqjD/DUF883 family membrane-anchored ribosome-binding protein